MDALETGLHKPTHACACTRVHPHTGLEGNGSVNTLASICPIHFYQVSVIRRTL